MAYLLKIASRKEFDSVDLAEMHRLRAKVFKERMGWDIPVISGLEIDGYDALDPHYLMIREPSKGLCGCIRVLPTEGPYMLKDTFPQLLYGSPPPQNRKIWELSRLTLKGEAQGGFGFSELSLEMLREMFLFGNKMGLDSYVTVTTSSIERMLRRSGLSVTRYGPPMRIGVENTVALQISLDEQTHDALFGKLQKAA